MSNFQKPTKFPSVTSLDQQIPSQMPRGINSCTKLSGFNGRNPQQDDGTIVSGMNFPLEQAAELQQRFLLQQQQQQQQQQQLQQAAIGQFPPVGLPSYFLNNNNNSHNPAIFGQNPNEAVNGSVVSAHQLPNNSSQQIDQPTNPLMNLILQGGALLPQGAATAAGIQQQHSQTQAQLQQQQQQQHQLVQQAVLGLHQLQQAQQGKVQQQQQQQQQQQVPQMNMNPLHQIFLQQQQLQQQLLAANNQNNQQQQSSQQQQQHQQQQQQQQQLQTQQQAQQQLMQIIRLQQQQQQQEQASIPTQNLVVHLSLLNDPLLIFQLYKTVSNPIENARFQGLLLRLNPQMANQLNGNLPQIQGLPQGLALPIQGNPAAGFLQSQNQQPSSQLQLSSHNLIEASQHQLPMDMGCGGVQQRLISQQKQKEELTVMLQFLVDKMHQCETDQIFEKKKDFLYIQDEDLVIFDNIVHKYQFSKKTKEEMIKYILRKCFKFLKSNIKQQEIVGQKDVEVAFTRKYFGNEIESQQQLLIHRQFMSTNPTNSQLAPFSRPIRDSDDDDDDDDDIDQGRGKPVSKAALEFNSVIVKQEQCEAGAEQQAAQSKNQPTQSSNNLDQEDLIEKVMPFKQGSKIKTMNIQFLKMIFRSELFAKDYQNYLDKFEELAHKENQKKIQKCVKNLQDFIEKHQISKVKSYKRLPWLKIWLDETYELAKTLISYADEENGKEDGGISSQTDLKKKIKTSSQIDSSSKLQPQNPQSENEVIHSSNQESQAKLSQNLGSRSPRIDKLIDSRMRSSSPQSTQKPKPQKSIFAESPPSPSKNQADAKDTLTGDANQSKSSFYRNGKQSPFLAIVTNSANKDLIGSVDSINSQENNQHPIKPSIEALRIISENQEVIINHPN